MMPQWEFIDFLRDEVSVYPEFALRTEAEFTEEVKEDDRTAGVRIATGEVDRVDAVTIFADGRSSLVRRKGLLPMEALGAPMDVFWFKLPKSPHQGDALRGSVQTGRMVVLIDRRTYWQC